MQVMKFVCEIDMMNAAFEDPEELIRILKEQVIKKLEGGNISKGTPDSKGCYLIHRLKDSNGNFVGQWAFNFTKENSHD